MSMIIVEQLRSGGCLSYVVGFPNKEALVIDAAGDTSQIKKALDKHHLRPALIIETHTHADHFSRAPELSTLFNVPIVMSDKVKEQRTYSPPDAIKDIIKKNSSFLVGKHISDAETLKVGGETVTFLHTPGHTKDSLVVSVGHLLFTGDTLLVSQVGRDDFPGSDAGEHYESIMKKIMPLADDRVIYPGHDYSGNINTTLGYEKVHNSFLQSKTKEEFAKKSHAAFKDIKPGMMCGAVQPSTPAGQASFKEEMMNTMIRNFQNAARDEMLISSQQLKNDMDAGKKMIVLDVREPDEVKSGKIRGAFTIPLPQLSQRVGELPLDLDTPIVTTCQHGGRASTAAVFLRGMGYRNVRNLIGATQGWKMNKYPID